MNSGELRVSAALGGSLEIAAGGRVTGSGRVGDTTARGTVAPGDSIGQPNVNGNYTHVPTGTLEIEVDAAGSSDLLAVTGNAQLNGGTVAVLAASGTYDISTRYTVLTAGGGVTGEFDDVNLDAAFLDPSLSYEPDAVTLLLQRNDFSFSDVATNPNQRGVPTFTGRGRHGRHGALGTRHVTARRSANPVPAMPACECQGSAPTACDPRSDSPSARNLRCAGEPPGRPGCHWAGSTSFSIAVARPRPDSSVMLIAARFT